MTSNQFYLRKEYQTQEMVDRIPSSSIRPGNDDFVRVLQDYGLDPDAFSDLGKKEFLERVNYEFEGEEKDEFIEDLFDKCGQEGDKFNVQVFSLPSERDYEPVYNKAQSEEGTELGGDYSFLSHTLFLDQVEQGEIEIEEKDWSSEVIDLAFKTRETVEDIEPTEELPIRIVEAGTGELEAEYSDDFIVEAPSRDRIEARLYAQSKTVAISNGGNVVRGLQSDILELITEWGEKYE